MAGPAVVAKLQAKNVVSLALSIFNAIGLLVRTRHLLPATHPILMSIGRITASFGFLPVPYKASEIPPALKAGRHITES